MGSGGGSGSGSGGGSGGGRSGGGGVGRVMFLGIRGSTDKNRWVKGSGVGGISSSNRAAYNRRASNKCSP